MHFHNRKYFFLSLVYTRMFLYAIGENNYTPKHFQTDQSMRFTCCLYCLLVCSIVQWALFIFRTLFLQAIRHMLTKFTHAWRAIIWPAKRNCFVTARTALEIDMWKYGESIAWIEKCLYICIFIFAFHKPFQFIIFYPQMPQTSITFSNAKHFYYNIKIMELLQ